MFCQTKIESKPLSVHAFKQLCSGIWVVWRLACEKLQSQGKRKALTMPSALNSYNDSIS